jgi:hypothetical protein
VRGYDQTDVRRRRFASAWLILVVTWVALAAFESMARGQGSPVAVWQGDERESIVLRADRIYSWTDGGAEWFRLEDQAVVVQGDVSILADHAVVKVVRAGRADGSVWHVQLYAEGNVRDPATPDASHREVRTELKTRLKIGIDARVPKGRHVLQKPPQGLPILARAFPKTEDPPKPAMIAATTPALTRQTPVAKPPTTTTAAATPKAPGSLPVIPTSETLPVLLSDSRAQALAPLPVIPTAANLPAAQNEVKALPTDEEIAQAGPSTVPFGSDVPPLPAKADPAVQRSQTQNPPPLPPIGGDITQEPGFPDDFSVKPSPTQIPAPDQPPMAPNSVPLGPSTAPPRVEDLPSNLLPLPGAAPPEANENPGMPIAPSLPGSQRKTTIYPRGLGKFEIESENVRPDGTQVIVIRNGVNIHMQSKEQGIVDIEADSVIIWRRNNEVGDIRQSLDQNNELIDNGKDPLEFYLEGHVIVRQDQLLKQGNSDQRTYKADQVYYDVTKDQLLAQQANLDLFSPGLVSPLKISSPRIFQYHPMVTDKDGRTYPSSLAAIQADRTVATGSRFADPGYKFTSRSIDMKQVVDNRELAKDDGVPFDQDDLTWLLDARQNLFFFGPVPVFYLPRLYKEADDLNPALIGIGFGTNNYFGQQFRSSFDVFNLLGQRHPPPIDSWILDFDYLSGRDKKFGEGIAVGSELGWFGTDLINDLKNPYRKKMLKDDDPSLLTAYSGYFDIFGLFDGSRDVLGGGPAIITDSPDHNYAGRDGFTRLSNPFFNEFRGIVTFRHMQSLDTKDTPIDEDYRFNLEVGYFSDRNFLEQYFKHKFDTGLDQENLLYGIAQKQNSVATFLTETNLQNFNTETQWYPKMDYYTLGTSLLNDRLTYSQHTGIDYANVHTAAEVNNRTIFAYLPTDPVSNTKGTFSSGRFYSAQELDLPLSFDFIKATPYVQGQVVGWNNQISGSPVGRIWGAVGGRADFMMHKAYPTVESELLNIHGLNHKIDFVVDYRDGFSNVNLNSLGVQDDLDDNTYEYSRRYFALTNYIGGVLPGQYDPRNLILRRAQSPISGSTDIQGTMETLKMGIHQRLQTKRGPEGKRHIMDYMVFDLDTTYFPMASRDNFGTPFGQNFYNYEWYIGDRTSILSYGWFEFWKIAGDPYLNYNTSLDKNDPFGLHIITSGISITRIPKGNIFIGYTIVNTGPINTSALNAQYSYWLSPKWFGSISESYDFGDGLLLGATGALTRIGADYMTSVGLAVSPLQHSYQFTFTISPRLSPSIQFGSAAGLTRLDSRFAPVE